MSKENIYITDRVPYLMEVCRKLNNLKEKYMNPAKFLKYIITNIRKRQTIVMVYISDKKLVEEKDNDQKVSIDGCVVLTRIKTLTDDDIFWIDFVWIDPQKKEISFDILSAIEEIARGGNITKLAGRATRGFKAAAKKYGFKESYRVLEKEVQPLIDNRQINKE